MCFDMAAVSHLLVGLGNPGPRYFATRHNIGFAMLDYLARKNGLSFIDSGWQAKIAEAVLWKIPLLLVKPETYMNASGTAVIAVVDWYDLPPERVLVIHDDIDLPVGRIKMVTGGGAGGHKGVQSIIDNVKTKNIPRMKIGVGRPLGVALPVEHYVLSRFSAEEIFLIERKKELVEKSIELFVTKGIVQAMNFVNAIKEI